jgi:hypothetical protein
MRHDTPNGHRPLTPAQRLQAVSGALARLPRCPDYPEDHCAVMDGGRVRCLHCSEEG